MLSTKSFDNNIYAKTVDQSTLFNLLENDIENLISTTPATLMPSGSVSNPGLSFELDQDTGFYLLAPNTLNISCGGFNVAQFSDLLSQINFNLRCIFPNGTSAEPAVNFGTGNGMFFDSTGAGSVNIAEGGSIKAQFGSSFINLNEDVRLIDGSSVSPAFSFVSDTNTGIYRVGADELGFSTGGALRMIINNNEIDVVGNIRLIADGEIGNKAGENIVFDSTNDELQIQCAGATRWTFNNVRHTSTEPIATPAGVAGTPAYSFTTDLNSGIYNPSDGVICVSTNSADTLIIATDKVESMEQIRAPNGAVGTPSYSFTNSTNTGFYYSGSDPVWVNSGAEVFRLGTSQLVASQPIRLPTYTIAGLPAGISRQIVTVSNDAVDANVPCWYDGTNWRKLTDGTIPSV